MGQLSSFCSCHSFKAYSIRHDAMVSDIRQIGRGSFHFAQGYRSTYRNLKATETDRLIEDIILELFLPPESARFDFTSLDQSGADARHVQRALVKGEGAAGAGVQSCGDHSITET